MLYPDWRFRWFAGEADRIIMTFIGAGRLARRFPKTTSAVALLVLVALPAKGAAASPSLATLFSFTEPASGQEPRGGLLIGRSGVLYGTTSGGGTGCGCGTVFALTPPTTRGGAWTETVLHRFDGADGSGPVGDLVSDASGALYGTTPKGGKFDHGAVFRLAPPSTPGAPWTEIVLHSFTALADGNDPGPRVILDKSGNLYGVTQFNSTGAGNVFELQRPVVPDGLWQLEVLWTFGGDGDAANPLGGLIFGKDGALYGTTYGGGAFATGAVFRLARPTAAGGTWSEQVIYSFPALRSGGANPYDGLVANISGALFGTTFIGGKYDDGVAFELQPSATRRRWTESVLHSFADNGSDGFNPVAPLAFGRSGALYGTTPVGGLSDAGTVFELLPPSHAGTTWTEKVLWSFHSLPVGGSGPTGGLIRDAAGALYGTTQLGGENCTPPTGCGGTVFMLLP
jgi:uncharacterized repeat protein (TIGR03803 family)